MPRCKRVGQTQAPAQTGKEKKEEEKGRSVARPRQKIVGSARLPDREVIRLGDWHPAEICALQVRPHGKVHGLGLFFIRHACQGPVAPVVSCSAKKSLSSLKSALGSLVGTKKKEKWPPGTHPSSAANEEKDHCRIGEHRLAAPSGATRKQKNFCSKARAQRTNHRAHKKKIISTGIKKRSQPRRRLSAKNPQ